MGTKKYDISIYLLAIILYRYVYLYTVSSLGFEVEFNLNGKNYKNDLFNCVQNNV